MGDIADSEHMASEIWRIIGLGNALLPDGTKPQPAPMLCFLFTD